MFLSSQRISISTFVRSLRSRSCVSRIGGNATFSLQRVFVWPVLLQNVQRSAAFKGHASSLWARLYPTRIFLQAAQGIFCGVSHLLTPSHTFSHSSTRAPSNQFFPFNGLNPRHIILIRKS